jgi:hypothetical protein
VLNWSTLPIVFLVVKAVSEQKFVLASCFRGGQHVRFVVRFRIRFHVRFAAKGVIYNCKCIVAKMVS